MILDRARLGGSLALSLSLSLPFVLSLSMSLSVSVSILPVSPSRCDLRPSLAGPIPPPEQQHSQLNAPRQKPHPGKYPQS